MAPGINPNRRQLGFANALARSRALGDRVAHREGDAGVFLGGLAPASYDRVLAIECISYFSDRTRFFGDVHRVLRSGGSLGFCCNVARAPLTPLERAVVALTWGFVPRSAEDWTESVRAAGFRSVSHRDITDWVALAADDRSVSGAARRGRRSHAVAAGSRFGQARAAERAPPCRVRATRLRAGHRHAGVSSARLGSARLDSAQLGSAASLHSQTR